MANLRWTGKGENEVDDLLVTFREGVPDAFDCAEPSAEGGYRT
jgi:hypothetical protein